jgi:hypothetical protein
MGKASSTKKVARAARSAGRPGTGRNLISPWSALITGVVILGVVLIVASRGENEDSKPPVLGDHWHAAYGIYDCTDFIPPLNDQVQDVTGIHTHSDGLIHIHPFSTRYTGDGATLNAWGETVGMVLSDDEIDTDPLDRENGDSCGDEDGIVQVKVWSGLDDDEGRLLAGDFGDYAIQEFDIITIAFAPEGAELPKPPQQYIDEMQAPSDVVGERPNAPTQTVPLEQTDTSAPAEGTEDTTAPGEDTTDASAPADEDTTDASAPADDESTATTADSTPATTEP